MSDLRRSSAFRMWACSGLAPPSFEARIASSGSLISGFCGAGSFEAAVNVGCEADADVDDDGAELKVDTD